MANFSATLEPSTPTSSTVPSTAGFLVQSGSTVYCWRGKTGGGSFVNWLTLNFQDPTGVYAPSGPLTEIVLEGSFTR